MNTDIELVESALSSVIAHNKEKDAPRIELYELKLKELLAKIPQTVYYVTEDECYADVDGVRFYCEGGYEKSYGARSAVFVHARHKKLKNYIFWSRVKWVNSSCSGNYSSDRNWINLTEKVQWILEEHLKALKWENEKNNVTK